MKKVISLLTLILCAMLIITGCDPAATTPGTGGNTTIPSNPDDNPLIPDDKPSDDADLLPPVESQENIINTIYAKFQEAKSAENLQNTLTNTVERTFKDSVYEIDDAGTKTLTANGSLKIEHIEMTQKVNGKVTIKDSDEIHTYEAKNLELILTFEEESELGLKYKSGELKVNGKLLTEEEITGNAMLLEYIMILTNSSDFSNLTEKSAMENKFSFDGLSFHSLLVGSVGNTKATATDAVIAEYNGDILKIGYIVEISSTGPITKLDYASINGEYISVGKCSETLKEKLLIFSSTNG